MTKFVLLAIFLIGILSGWQKNILTPESQLETVPFAGQMNLIPLGVFPVYSQNPNEIPSFVVHYKIRGKNVFVECVLTGISFRESDQSKQKVGKLLVWIDGMRTKEVTSAAFIMKGLSPGDHKVKLEVVNLNNIPYGLTKEFLVNIPKE